MCLSVSRITEKVIDCYGIFEGWGVPQAKNRSILVLIRIMIRIRQFLTEFLPLRDQGNCKNFVGSAAWRMFAVSECKNDVES